MDKTEAEDLGFSFLEPRQLERLQQAKGPLFSWEMARLLNGPGSGQIVPDDLSTCTTDHIKGL
jgi:hypothetical protein